MNRCRGQRRPLTAGSTIRHLAIGDRGWFRRGHGSYRRLDLALPHPADEAGLTCLIEAIHPELADALGSDEEMIAGGGPFSPGRHIATVTVETR